MVVLVSLFHYISFPFNSFSFFACFFRIPLYVGILHRILLLLSFFDRASIVITVTNSVGRHEKVGFNEIDDRSYRRS